MASQDLDDPEAAPPGPDDDEAVGDPLVERALSALDDRFFRTGEPVDQAGVARICERHGLEPVQVAVLTRHARARGLIATDATAGPDDVDHDPVEAVERVGGAVPLRSEWDSLRQLFESARRYPLLTAQQEKALARRYMLGERARARLAEEEAGGLPADIRAELEGQAADGRRAKDAFVCCNLRLVASIARIYRGQGLDLADLVQEGTLGLIRAVEKFDHTMDYKLSTYATWWIRQSIVRGIANTGRTIRLPVHIHELVRKILMTERRLCWELEREPTIEDIAARLKEDPAHVAFVKDAASSIVSLDARVRGDGDGAELIELIAGAEPPVDMAVIAESERDTIRELLDALPYRERRVLELRYGLLDDERRTLDDIGRTFNVTRERIRQLETKALKKMRGVMEAQGLVEVPPPEASGDETSLDPPPAPIVAPTEPQAA